MITPEQEASIGEIFKKYNYTPPSTTGGSNWYTELTKSPVDVQKETQGNQFEQKPTTFLGKARNVITSIIGGGALAEGAGKAIAAPFVRKQVDEADKGMSDVAMLLIKQIRENKEQGKDTSRLEAALGSLQGAQEVNQDVQNDFIESLPSNKEVIGSAAQLATTLSGGAIGRFGAKATGLAKATSLVGGALRGAGTGAISGAVGGGLYGASAGLQANKDLEGIAKSGLVGAGLGAVIGAPLGAITGGTMGFLKGRQLTRETFAEELVSPKQTNKERINAIRQGRLEDPGLFKKAELQYSRRDKELAEAVRDVVSPKASLGENIDALRLQVNQTNNGVKGYIQTHKVPFNTNQLKSQLKSAKGDLELIFASDANAQKTYDKVVDVFMDNMGKKDTLGLFEGRQTFDQLPAVQKLLNTDALGENARKEIVLAVRKAANDYIASLLPKGSIYKEAMLSEHYMLEALGNIAEKNANIIGKNNLQILVQQYPFLKAILGGLAAGAGVGAVGVGASIIGSTD